MTIRWRVLATDEAGVVRVDVDTGSGFRAATVAEVDQALRQLPLFGAADVGARVPTTRPRPAAERVESHAVTTGRRVRAPGGTTEHERNEADTETRAGQERPPRVPHLRRPLAARANEVRTATGLRSLGGSRGNRSARRVAPLGRVREATRRPCPRNLPALLPQLPDTRRPPARVASIRAPFVGDHPDAAG